MARDLKRGDRLRMLGSVVEVRGVDIDKNQTVYNLDVAENGDFFVGEKGLLVHDSKFVKPVNEPFDLEPAIGHPLDKSKHEHALDGFSRFWEGEPSVRAARQDFGELSRAQPRPGLVKS